MKKILSLFVLLLGMSCVLFAASKQRKTIDDFFKEYETFVVKAEKAAASNKLSDLNNLSMESLKLTEACQKVENTADWTLADSQKYLELTNRYSAAINKLSGNTSATSADANAALNDYNDMLKSYGY